jgi:hypothetical protein
MLSSRLVLMLGTLLASSPNSLSPIEHCSAQPRLDSLVGKAEPFGETKSYRKQRTIDAKAMSLLVQVDKQA